MKIDFIHIGLHKTASTYLQMCLFPKVDNLLILNNLDGDIDTWFYDNFIKVDAYSFNKVKFLSDFESLIKAKSPNIDSDSVLGISEENLSGDMYTGMESKELMNRIHDVFGDVHILIVIRNQVDYILSSYSNYILAGGTHSISTWFYGPNTKRGKIINKLQYSGMLNGYCNKFKRENVTILLYEDLFSLQGIEKFLGEFQLEYPKFKFNKNNIGRSVFSNHLLAFFNKFYMYKVKGRQQIFALIPGGRSDRDIAIRLLENNTKKITLDNKFIMRKYSITLSEEYFF